MNIIHRRAPITKQLTQTRHRPPVQPARHNQPKVRQVRINIQRKPVHRHPTTHPHPDRAHLRKHPITLDPNPSRRLVAHAHNTKRPDRIDHRLLKQPQVRVQPTVHPIQIHHRIPHHLPGPVIRHIPAAIRLVHLDVQPSKLTLVRQHMPSRSRPPRHRDHRIMLDKQQLTDTRPIAPRRKHALKRPHLLRVRLGIPQTPKIANNQFIAHHRS